MRLNYGAKSWICPQPVFVVGTYNSDGTPNAMTCVWGGQSSESEILLSLGEEHATTKNIIERKMFTVSMATADHAVRCDFIGLVSANFYEGKMEGSGFTTEPAQFVDAPIIKELPITFECRLMDYDPATGHLFGQIVNLTIEKSVLGTNGRPDPALVKPLIYDPANQYYYSVGEKVGKAFKIGKELRG